MNKRHEKLFANAVTSLAFHLTLSKNMVIALAGITGDVNRSDRAIYTAFGAYDTVVTSCRALEERGLIHAPDPKWAGRYKLTKAGEHVVELLKISGLIQTVKAANDKNAALDRAKGDKT